MSHNNKDPWQRKRQIFSSQGLVEKKKRRRLKVLPILWLAFKRTSTLIGAAVIISSVVSVWMMSSILGEIDASMELAKLSDEMVLYLEIDGDLPDLAGEANFSQPFSRGSKTLRNYVDALERAAVDPRVKGIYATLKSGGMSVAHAQEFRKALEEFKASGKFSYIYALSYDQGLGCYYLANAFDEMWMQPMGVVMLSGISAQVPYVRRLLDKIGVYPQIYKRKEYKSAYDTFTESKMPDASRREMKALIGDIASTLSADIASDMEIKPRAFKTLVDKGLYVDQEALGAGLIDVLDYEDVLIEKINKQVTGDPKSKDLAYVKFDSYVSEMLKVRSGNRARGRRGNIGKKIALVYAQGMIVEHGSMKAGSSVVFGKSVIAADKLAPVLLKVAEDKRYSGVVLRIDSPGGSPVASETLLRAVQKVQEAGKSVTVSMGTVAASGGYWIASSADQIFVLPTTLTGSIGVLGGKFSMVGLWDKLDVNWDEVSWGDKAGMWSINRPYNAGEAERINAMMDNVYTNFVSRVAIGRGMSKEDVEKVARGRVWSGKRAVTVGLADQIGGLNDALDYAARQVGAKDRYGVAVEIVPKPRTPIEQLIELLESQVLAGKSFSAHVLALGSFFAQISDVLAEQRALSSGAGAVVYEPAHLSVQ